MDMNSGKSMDDILDSIRRIVHEEETGEPAPERPASRSETLSQNEGDMETLVLTREMRVDLDDDDHEEDDTLMLGPDAEVAEEDEADEADISDETREAIASLRLRPGAADTAEEPAPTLRLHSDWAAAEDDAADESDDDEGADEATAEAEEDDAEVAAFGAALAEDEAEETVAEDDVERDENGFAVQPPSEEDVDRDEFGFVIPPPEAPAPSRFALNEMEELEAPAGRKPFSLRFDRRAPAEEPAEAPAQPAQEAADEEDLIAAASPLEDAVEETYGEEAEDEAAAAEAWTPSGGFMESEEVEGADASRAQIERMVRSAVREELSGALGDKITRNIRAMVRKEITRALETKQLK